MAAPIKPTPILTGTEATEWQDRVEKHKNEKTGLVPTPKLAKLRERLLANAECKK